MDYPISTGRVAALLSASEPKLNDLLRRRKIDPTPPIVAGRRLWQRNHVLQAADALGLLTPELESRLERDCPGSGATDVNL